MDELLNQIEAEMDRALMMLAVSLDAADAQGAETNSKTVANLAMARWALQGPGLRSDILPPLP